MKFHTVVVACVAWLMAIPVAYYAVRRAAWAGAPQPIRGAPGFLR